jgi:adenosine deaminase
MGVFSTSMSEEFVKVAQELNLTKEEIFNISKNSVEFIFDSNEVKEKLLNEFENFQKEEFQNIEI